MNWAARSAVIACAFAVLGCASKPFDVRPIDEEVRFRRENLTALTSDDLSERTRTFLQRNLLDAGDLPALHDRLLERHERELAFCLAEITFLKGKESRDSAEAAKCFLSSAAYAYAFLFDDKLGAPPSAYDPLFRWSCDIYNRALGHVVDRAAERRTGPQPRARGSALLWEVEAERGRTETVWEPEAYERFLVTSNFEAKGFGRETREYGLGVPVVGIRKPPGAKAASEAERFLPPTTLVQAGTIVARFDEIPAAGGVQHVQLEFLDPTRTHAIRIGAAEVPLAADLTTPIAYAAARAPAYSGFDAMRHGERYEKYARLYMLQPYQPDRIPVVFVHGLMSKPLTWGTLFNEILADPVLRARYQVWFFRYPTGYPVLYSAALLREALNTAAKTYDPERRNPAFQHMVLCGHSMGGLLCNLQVHTSGDRLWRAVSDTPIDALDLGPDGKELLHRTLEFERLPFVTRVVFMAVPHRGSDFATGFIGRLGAALTDSPRKFEALSRATKPALRKEYRSEDMQALRRAMTGVGNLSPEHPVLHELASWPCEPGVTVHSIIGNERAAEPGGSDGVVAYESSHKDDVASEKVVRSGHSVQENLAAIAEVRRILRLHLEELEAGSAAPPRAP